MRQKSGSLKVPAEKIVQSIRSATRKRYSAEEKIRIVLESLRARRASPSCADARALPKISITVGRKTFLKAATPGGLSNAPGDLG